MIRNPNPLKEQHGDCGTRAVCLALDLPYQPTWREITALIRKHETRYRYGEWAETKATADGGTSRGILQRYLAQHRWVYQRAPAGTLFKADNMPPLCIAHQAGHWVCVKDGAVWDSWDSRGKRSKKLLGWFCPMASGG